MFTIYIQVKFKIILHLKLECHYIIDIYSIGRYKTSVTINITLKFLRQDITLLTTGLKKTQQQYNITTFSLKNISF